MSEDRISFEWAERPDRIAFTARVTAVKALGFTGNTMASAEVTVDNPHGVGSVVMRLHFGEGDHRPAIGEVVEVYVDLNPGLSRDLDHLERRLTMQEAAQAARDGAARVQAARDRAREDEKLEGFAEAYGEHEQQLAARVGEYQKVIAEGLEKINERLAAHEKDVEAKQPAIRHYDAGKIAQGTDELFNEQYRDIPTRPRTVAAHDAGAHRDSPHPYSYCDACELDHPRGRFHTLLEGADNLLEAIETVLLHPDTVISKDAGRSLDDAVAAYQEARKGTAP